MEKVKGVQNIMGCKNTVSSFYCFFCVHQFGLQNDFSLNFELINGNLLRIWVFLDGLEKIVGRDINFNIFMTGKTTIVNVSIITFVFSSCIFDTNDKHDVQDALTSLSEF